MTTTAYNYRDDKIRLADDAPCISESCTYKLRKLKPQRKCEIFGMPSKVVAVIPYGETREYWADIVTCTLYEAETLRCLSSRWLTIRWAK